MSLFLDLARARYSCRSFSEKPVERAKIDAIVQAGICAPTCVNRQPWHAWVITSPDALARAYASTRYNFHAPVVIALGVYPGHGWMRRADGHDFIDVDGAIVTTHMMLEAKDLGLESVWVGYFDPAVLQANFPSMKDARMLALLKIGYKSEGAQPSSLHEAHKSVEELVDFI